MCVGEGRGGGRGGGRVCAWALGRHDVLGALVRTVKDHVGEGEAAEEATVVDGVDARVVPKKVPS